ncbi:hypothetical protein BJF79_13805 [Actinomadura sp. CNU-125]|uniref:hypothetical protein n=1 Tax=Actinomadura sp. CNU-125 TaxID=1904961 RepID=UPI00095D7E36|nr:hypothetical protein [Actinomadura sp. CNU-125]OLT24412.1 hypothetical protein BJF79_13805 [Actinomadura sp. CNU-125]
MAVLENTFEGGTPGTAVTVANSGGLSGDAFNEVDPSSSTITYSSGALHGTVACQITTVADDDPYFAWTSLVSGTTTWGRVYLKIGSLPPDNINIVRHLAGTATVITVRVNSNGRLGLLYGTGTFAGNGTVAIPVDTWVRIEWTVTTGLGTGSVQATLYTDPESTTPADTLSTSSINTGTASAVTRQRMGMLSSETWSFALESVAFSDEGPIGPEGGGGPVAVDATDTVALADAAVRATSSVTRAAADSLAGADAATRTSSSSRAATGSLSLGDGAVAVVTRARATVEAFTVVDTATQVTAGVRAAADALDLADAAVPTTGHNVTAADGLAFADAAARALNLARVGDDRLIPGDGTNADLLDLDDAAARVTVAARAAVDGLGIAEAVAATSGQMVSASDMLTLDDAVARVLTADRGAVDALALTDAASRATAGQRAATDEFALGDAASGATGQTVTAADPVTLTDSPGRVLALAGAAADGLVLADAAGRTFTAGRSVADALTLADVVAAGGGEPPAGRGTVTLTGYPAAELAERPDATVTSYGSEVNLR